MNHNEPEGLPLITVMHDLAQHDLREDNLERIRGAYTAKRYDAEPIEDCGKYYDYEIIDQSDRWILLPVTTEALVWCHQILSDNDRYSARGRAYCGFIVNEPITTDYSKTLLDKLWSDKLYSDEDRANETERGWR